MPQAKEFECMINQDFKVFSIIYKSSCVNITMQITFGEKSEKEIALSNEE